MPPGFGKYLGRSRASELARTWINRLCIAIPSVRRSLTQTDVIIASNTTTRNFLPAAAQSKTIVIPANAVAVSTGSNRLRGERQTGDRFTMLYAGNCVARRGISLALEALALAQLENAHFYIAGDGPALKSWKAKALLLGLDGQVTFTGRVSRKDLGDLYAQADAFLFPSLRDSGGSGLLEAMENEVPVVCLDWGGPAEMVDNQSGIKIPVTDPANAVQNLSLTLARLQAHPGEGRALSIQARRGIAERFSWERKRELIQNIYPRIIQPSRPTTQP